MAKRYHATKKFEKLAALNSDIDEGGHAGIAARKAKSKMNEAWFNRGAASTLGFFDQKKAREIKRGAV